MLWVFIWSFLDFYGHLSINVCVKLCGFFNNYHHYVEHDINQDKNIKAVFLFILHISHQKNNDEQWFKLSYLYKEQMAH